MTRKQDLHLAYVLHTRSYRETSLLVEILSVEHGRVALVARGAKRGKAKDSQLLQQFSPLYVSWVGNGDLVTLTEVEAYEPRYNLQATSAICGLYINELLVKLVPKWDPCEMLFYSYVDALQQLALNNVEQQIVLRKFEMQLLQSIGYGLQLSTEVGTGNDIQADKCYMFDPILGPRLLGIASASGISGKSLLALAKQDFTDPAILLEIKRIMRIVFSHHLGARQLKTRELLE